MGRKTEGGGNPNGGSPQRLPWLAARGSSKITATGHGVHEFHGTSRATRPAVHKRDVKAKR